MQCSLCDRPAKVRGWCNLHYQRWLAHGDPTKILTTRGTNKGTVNGCGYRTHWVNGKNKPEHIIIAEKALGKPLPKGAEVHHVDGNRLNNNPSNLVICPDRKYHALLEWRTKYLNASAYRRSE